MAIQLTWLGHGGWSIQTGEHTLLLDPFVDECPTAICTAEDLAADYILVSHGHFDHISDVPAIAHRTQAKVVANFEIAAWLTEKHQVGDAIGMNIGGSIDLPFGRVKMVLAHHSSQLPDGSYGGTAAGFLITIAGKRLYFACDTAFYSDMQLIGRESLDLAVLPIGDLYTMGPEDSIRAMEILKPKQVAPAHYNTWPPIAQNAEAWANAVREAGGSPVVVAPGESFSV